jgi:RNA recognition motif-containing protein
MALVVRRTFIEVDSCNLEERSNQLRRSRCHSEGLPSENGIWKAEHCKVEADQRSNASTGLCWSDMSDDESDCGSMTSSSTTSQPSCPPGVFQPASFKTKAKKVALWSTEKAQEGRTTVLFRNVLPTSSRSHLCELLNQQGFFGCYDFLYVPANFKTMLSFGYAFVNFTSSSLAESAKEHFNNFAWTVCGQQSTLETSWSDPHQGYAVHVERYRDCPVMHASVADEYKPVVFRAGVRVPFPPPTKRLVAPRDVRRRHGA